MKYLLVLSYFLSWPASALTSEQRPLIFPGGQVAAVTAHKLVVTGRGNWFNRALMKVVGERQKVLPVPDRTILGVIYVRGVPFVVTDAGDRKGPQLEWAVVTTYQEGLSPGQKGRLIIAPFLGETVAFAVSPDWKTFFALTAANAVATVIAHPTLTRARGVSDLELALKPVQLDGKAAAVTDFRRDEEGRLTDVLLGVGDRRVNLRDLAFRRDQADRLERLPPAEDELVLDRRLLLRDGRLIAKARWYDSGKSPEAEGPFSTIFELNGATFASREDGTLDRVRIMRRKIERSLYLSVLPVTLDAVPVTIQDIVRDEDDRQIVDVVITAEIPVEGLSDLVLKEAAFNLGGFPLDASCSNQLKTTDHKP